MWRTVGTTVGRPRVYNVAVPKHHSVQPCIGIVGLSNANKTINIERTSVLKKKICDPLVERPRVERPHVERRKYQSLSTDMETKTCKR